jgi:hypothetical protein
MMGVAKLDVPTYESIEHDASATSQAAIVVAIVAVASGIGAITESDNAILGLIGGIIAAFAGWVLFAYVAYFVGTKLIPGDNTSATPGELLRTMGFAQTPGLLAIFGVLGTLGGFIVFVGGIWSLVTAIVGLRQALDCSTGRAIGIGLLSWLITAIVLFFIFLPFGIAAWAVA